MRKLLIPMLITAAVLAAILGLFQVARGQSPTGPGSSQVVKSENQGDNIREISAPAGQNASEAPDISFIDSPTAACYQPDSTQDDCYINWYSAYVDAGSGQYMNVMTVTLNTIGIVGYYQGFFQQTLYVPFNMVGPGYKVACGPLGAGGRPTLGNSYGWTIKARASDGLKSANYGTIYCPAFTP